MAELQVATPSEREVVMRRTFAAPRALVFEAFTKPELVRRWLLGPDGWSMPVCEIALEVGGSFRYVWRNDENEREFGISGTYREIVRPERIVHLERMDGFPEAVVTTLFTEHDGSTSVSLTVEYASREIRDDALESGMADGVAASYDRLQGMLETAAS